MNETVEKNNEIIKENEEALKELNEKCHIEFEKVKNSYLDILSKYVGVCEKIFTRDCEYFGITLEKDSYADIDIHYRVDRWKDSDKSKRILKLNFGTSGSFDKDSHNVRKYSVIGKLCDNMKEIEDAFNSVDRDALDSIREEISLRNWKISNAVSENKTIALTEKKEEILGKLKIGTVIDIRPDKNYDEEHYLYRLKHLEIEWMTKKNLSFKGDYGKRTKIENALNDLASGKWKIVEGTENSQKETIDNQI